MIQSLLYISNIFAHNLVHASKHPKQVFIKNQLKLKSHTHTYILPFLFCIKTHFFLDFKFVKNSKIQEKLPIIKNNQESSV